MVREAVLARMSDKVTAYIERYVTLAGAAEREEVLEMFDSMHLLFPNWVIATCPVMHPDIHYVSRNSPHILGYNKDHLLNALPVDKFFSFVHDADQEGLYSCLNFAHDHLQSIPPELHYQYRSIFYYRFKKENGQYIYLHDEKAVLNLRGSGNLYYTLFRDISTDKNFNGVKVEVFKQDLALRKIAEFKPSAERSMLTKREGELVTLIKRGLSTKEIAWYLNISHHTVRNIKSKLFEKYNVNNTIELLNMTA